MAHSRSMAAELACPQNRAQFVVKQELEPPRALRFVQFAVCALSGSKPERTSRMVGKRWE